MEDSSYGVIHSRLLSSASVSALNTPKENFTEDMAMRALNGFDRHKINAFEEQKEK